MAKLRNHPAYWLRDDAAAAFDRAESDHGVFIVNSAGRTEAEQQGLIDRWNKGGSANRPPYLYKPAMPKTASNHVAGGGKAIDIGDWRRFAKICAAYGFRHSLPETDPVHFDFIGITGNGGSSFNQTVQDQQGWLISRGYDLGPTGADGIAGPRYTAAVKSYQTFLKSYGYKGEIDGQWGSGTQSAHNDFLNYLTHANAELKLQQQWLISRGYDLGPSGADGVWGASTEKAFKQYQTFLKAFGYSGDIDGKWGSGTQAAHEVYVRSLSAVPTIPAYPLPVGKWFGPEGGGPNSVSGWHSYGAELMQWQQRMKDRGWPITVDGKYGPKGATVPTGNTAEVTVAFQKEKGLNPDGLIGSSTWKAAWETPVTPTPPIPDPPKPVDPPKPSIPDDELAATPNLITPTAADFPSWIKFDMVADPEGQKPNLNFEAAGYYGVPYNPIEVHLHWWNTPGNGGTHDGNVSYIKNTKDLSVNFVTSEKRITLMVPLNKIALTTGKRNPYAWKMENDPTLTDWGYKTMGYLVYIVEKLNPVLANEPLRLHKEFYNTSCSDIDKIKVRAYADAFRDGTLNPLTGVPPALPPEPEIPKPEVPEDMVLVPKSFIIGLAKEFYDLATDLEKIVK